MGVREKDRGLWGLRAGLAGLAVAGFLISAYLTWTYLSGAAMLVCAVLRGEKAALSGAFVALVGTLFSAYLSYLELFVLRAVCQWCLASAVLVIAYLVLGALRLRDTGSDVPEIVDSR